MWYFLYTKYSFFCIVFSFDYLRYLTDELWARFRDKLPYTIIMVIYCCTHHISILWGNQFFSIRNTSRWHNSFESCLSNIHTILVLGSGSVFIFRSLANYPIDFIAAYCDKPLNISVTHWEFYHYRPTKQLQRSESWLEDVSESEILSREDNRNLSKVFIERRRTVVSYGHVAILYVYRKAGLDSSNSALCLFRLLV